MGITGALMVVCLIGACSPWFVRDGLIAAYRKILDAADWLEQVSKTPTILDEQPYPPIIGRPKGVLYQHGNPKTTDPSAVATLSVGTIRLQILLTAAWILFFVTLLVLAF